MAKFLTYPIKMLESMASEFVSYATDGKAELAYIENPGHNIYDVYIRIWDETEKRKVTKYWQCFTADGIIDAYSDIKKDIGE